MEEIYVRKYIYIYTQGGKIHTEELNMEGDIRWKVHGREAKYTHGGDPYRRGDVLMEGAVRSIQHT